MFYLFAGDQYYPCIPPGDFVAKDEVFTELYSLVPSGCNWWVILDADMCVVDRNLD